MTTYEFIDESILDTKTSLPWVEKYRPEFLHNIVSHQDMLRTLRKLINHNNILHLMLYGPPGTGKTTTIQACARELYGDSINIMCLELNASDDRGIGAVRNRINLFAANNDMDSDLFNSKKRKQKLVILDEVDLMTYDAQFALRSVIEANTKTTRFCLICNYSTKIIKSLMSRCSIFIFPLIPYDLHLEHIKSIIKYENIDIEEEAIKHIVDIAMGDMRRSITILQSLSMVHHRTHITLNMLYENICQPLPQDLENIIDNIFTMNIKNAYAYAKQLENDKSLNVNDIIDNITSHIVKNKKFGIAKTARIITKLAQIEENLAGNTNPLIQLCGVISIIKE